MGSFKLLLEAPPGFEPGVKVLQTSALPLGYGAIFLCRCDKHYVIICKKSPVVNSNLQKSSNP